MHERRLSAAAPVSGQWNKLVADWSKEARVVGVKRKQKQRGLQGARGDICFRGRADTDRILAFWLTFNGTCTTKPEASRTTKQFQSLPST